MALHSIIKRWKLVGQQRVSVDHHHTVTFRHSSRNAITLTWRQFLNLNDIVMDLDTFKTMKYYPLGKNLWLQYYKSAIQLYDCKLNLSFTFHEISWRKYIKKTHRQKV